MQRALDELKLIMMSNEVAKVEHADMCRPQWLKLNASMNDVKTWRDCMEDFWNLIVNTFLTQAVCAREEERERQRKIQRFDTLSAQLAFPRQVRDVCELLSIDLYRPKFLIQPVLGMVLAEVLRTLLLASEGVSVQGDAQIAILKPRDS